jgi:hypothetical protein
MKTKQVIKTKTKINSPFQDEDEHKKLKDKEDSS